MKGRLLFFLVFMCVVLLAGCSPKQPPVFQLIQLFQEEKYDETIRLAEEVIGEDSDNAQAHRFLVKSAFRRGEKEKYRDKYQELVQANPDVAGYHFGLGYVNTQFEDFDAGIQELRKAIDLNPDIEYAHYIIGWIYLNPKYVDADAEKALAAWKKEEQLNPKSLGALQVYTDRADYYLRLNDPDAAEKDYEKITIYAFAPGDIAGARRLISRIRTLRDELARLEAAVKENPDIPEVRFQLGVMQYQNGMMKEAIETWLKATELDPNNAELRNYLGKALLESAQYGDAAQHLQKSVELDPTLTTAYYNLAVAEEYMGKTAGAIEHYKKYIELNPMTPKLDEVRQKVATLEGETGAEGDD